MIAASLMADEPVPPFSETGFGSIFAAAKEIRALAAPGQYTQGDPTPHEQFLMEMINRARANPPAEASRHGLADLNQGLSPGTISTSFKPPLVFHPTLITAARNHSQWMLDSDTFSHTGSGGSTATNRMGTAGYPMSGSWGTGENISWGGSTAPLSSIDLTAHTLQRHSGLFLSAGHRVNLLNAGYDEAGLGLLTGTMTSGGTNYPASSMLTENFAFSAGSPSPDGPFVTGVVYNDLDSDGEYDPGEGIAGVSATPSSGNFYAVTSTSGGYAFPVQRSAGTLTVTFNGGPFTNVQRQVAVATVNVKLDLAKSSSPTPTPTPSKLAWVNSKSVALARASSEGKLVLLLAGRESCGNTRNMRDTVCEMTSPAIRPLIDSKYVPWFCDVDSSTEWQSYASGLGSFTLPLIACINPSSPSTYIDRTTSVQNPNTFHSRLLANAPAPNPTPTPTRIIGISGNLTFGSVVVGNSTTSTMTIANTGNSPMAVSGITFPSGFSGSWSGSIAAGSSHDVSVTFTPTSTSSYGGTITVNSDKTSGTNTISCSGTGTQIGNLPNLTAFKPTGWADSVVISTALGDFIGAASIYDDQEIYVSHGSTNSSNVGITQTYTDKLLVDGTLKFYGTFTDLPANAYRTCENWPIGQLPAGTYTIQVFADANGDITESNESDNIDTRTITVLARPSPTPNPALADAVNQPALTFTNSGDLSWVSQTTTTHDGVAAAKSGAITHSQTSAMETTVSGPGSGSFWWKVSSENDFDFLTFYIDGVAQSGAISGEVDWQQMSFSLATGTHALKWVYSKDVSDSAGSDCGWVDQLTLPVPPTSTGSLQVAISPQGAIDAGAQWQLDNNGSWQSSESILSGVSTGNHTISFSSVNGWTTPGSQTVNVIANQTASASGTYVAVATRVIGISGNLTFGSVVVGSSTTRTMTIANTGSSPLNVSGITYPSGYSGNWTSGIIPANGTQTVEVTFSPTAAASYNGTVTVASDKTSGTSTIIVSGTGTPVPAPEIAVEQPTGTSLVSGNGTTDFGGIIAGESTAKTFTVFNTGTAPLNGLAVTIDGANSGDFSANTSGMSATLAPGESTAFAITFAGTAPGSRTASLYIASNDSNENPFNIGLNGFVTSRILGLTGSLAFRNVPVGSSVQRTFAITNTGNSPLNVSSISYPAGFSGNWTGGTISANGTQTVAVRFSPTQAVAYNNTITVASDATSGGNTLAVSGTGIDASALVPSFFEEFDTPLLNTFNWPGRNQWYGGDLRVENNRLAFTAIGKVPKNQNSEAVIESKPVGSYDSDFVFTADLGLDRDMSRNDNLRWRVNVVSSRSIYNFVRLEFSRDYASGTSQVSASLLNNYNIVASISLNVPANPNADKVRVKVVYDSVLRTMECLFAVVQDDDLVGDWTSLQSFGIDGNDGENGNTDWQMQPGDQFHLRTAALRSSTSNGSLENLFYGAYASRVWFADMGATLSVLSNAGPNGRVSPSGERMSREGGSLRYTAIPDPGYEVSSWLVNGANEQMGGTTYSLENIQADTDVEVQFKKMSSVPIIAGVYDGVVGDGQIGSGASGDMEAFLHGNGFLSLTTRANGSFTGTLRLEGKALAFKGQFNGSGDTSVTINRSGKTSVLVTLHFDPSGKITGTVTVDGEVLPFETLPTGRYNGVKTNLHPLTDNHYTTILPAPDATVGHGFATLGFSAKGIANLVGKLADGTGFTASVRTVDDGNGNWMVPVHIPLYAAKGGMLVGKVLVPKAEPSAAADVTGALEWLRPKIPNAKMFQNGFLKEISPIGERYQVEKNQSVLTGTGATANFTLSFDPAGVVLPDAITASGTWSASNVPLLAKPANATFTFTKSSGLFKGRFTQIVNGYKITKPYEGAVISHPLTPDGETRAIQGGGFFSNGLISGRVEITPP